jgi:hypothetical protein
MDRALVHDIDPKAVQLELAPVQLELQLARESPDMPGDRLFQIGEEAARRGKSFSEA